MYEGQNFLVVSNSCLAVVESNMEGMTLRLSIL